MEKQTRDEALANLYALYPSREKALIESAAEESEILTWVELGAVVVPPPLNHQNPKARLDYGPDYEKGIDGDIIRSFRRFFIMIGWEDPQHELSRRKFA